VAAEHFKLMEVPAIRRLLFHNYMEHVAALVSSPGSVGTVFRRCFGAEVRRPIKAEAPAAAAGAA
jgi:hypothetical protein